MNVGNAGNVNERNNLHEIAFFTSCKVQYTLLMENVRQFATLYSQGDWGEELFKPSKTGVANQSANKSHISYCVTATSHIIDMGTHEHHPISSLLNHILLLS